MRLIGLVIAIALAGATGAAIFAWRNTADAQHEHQDQQASQEAQTMVKVQVFDQAGKLVGPIEMPKVVLSDAQWSDRLSPQQFEVLRAKGTERPFCGTLLDNKKQGVYTCAGCGLPLFSSDSKFNS